MKNLFRALTVAALLLAGLSHADERVNLDKLDDDCALFRAMNGSEAVPEECKEDSKSAFTQAPSRPVPIVLQSITFDYDSNYLGLDAKTDLSRIAKIMRDPVSENMVYRLDGYTDLKGNPDYNLTLSKRRADAVRKYLVNIGVPPERLDSEGFGSQKLADPNHPYDLVNRRVEVVNVSRGSN